MPLINLDWDDGRTNPSGIKSIAYFVRRSDIAKFPTLAADAATAAEMVGYKDDIVLKTGKKFETIYTTQGVGKVSSEVVGEKDVKQPVNKATLSYPDINDEAKAFATRYCNANMVFIIPHNTASGVRYAVFGLDMDASLTPKMESGDKPGSTKGLTIEIEAPDIVALPNYLGVIETATGSLNCSTGVFTPVAEVPEG